MAGLIRDAISQIGIHLLLLLTGMEANLALVNRKRRAVISTSCRSRAGEQWQKAD